MKKILLIILVVLIPIWFLFYTNLSPAFSDELDEINKEIEELQQALDASKKATVPLESQLNNLTTRLDNIQARVSAIEVELEAKRESIAKGYLELGEQQESFNLIVKNSYIKTYSLSPLLLFFSSDDPGEFIKFLTYQKQDAERDKSEITSTALKLVDLEERKAKLEGEEKTLASIKASLDKEREEIAKIVDGAKNYQSELSGKIAELSARQQELLAQKFGSAPVPKLAVTSLGGCSSDIGKSPGFGNAIGFFSFGVPNKVGLNQYGAKGRAESGQPYETILNAYYDNFTIVDYDTGINITVNGTNPYGQTFNNESMNIEEYLKHLYEMPSGWDSKALQAQAVAARSYALYSTNNGQDSIQPSEYGQVVKKELNAQPWIDAVEATRGKVMTYNGQPIGAWYSSTHGGVILKSGQIGWADKPWTKQAIDTSSGSSGGFSELQSNAYDKQSPWFYCDWGYRKEYNSTAWLKEEEVVDIVNSYILWELDHNTITHLSQTDQSTPDTWSADRVRQEIQAKGGSPITSISSINVGWDGSGISKTITVDGKSFDAQKFKNMFNLRAPANIQIKPTCQPDSNLNCGAMYALFNVERQ